MKNLLETRSLPRPAFVSAALLGVALATFPASAQLSTCTLLAGTNCREHIPDGGVRNGTPFVGTRTSTMAVPAGACGAVTNVVDLNVQVRLKHNWLGDLRLRLVHPNGSTSATLLSNPGGAPAGLSGEDIDATFNDDVSGGALNVEIPDITGNVAPVSSLSVFDGLPRAGIWTLEVVDSRGGNYGALEDWTLELPCALPVVSIVATVADAIEAPTTNGTFTVTRTGETSAPILIPYTISGSASQGPDYTPVTGFVTMAAGVTTATITVQPVADGTYDNGESVIATLGTGDFTIGAGSAVVMIWDSPGLVGLLDRPIPTISTLGLALLALAVAAIGAGLLASRKLLG
ncbi:MAG: proprotein convertase P-domain-containing protein [Holophagales bacterium]|jgi:subtilisin-like proprotein convertase family protein|nr:proprotein convertase P-domain-containing protein [Holophagales bacterium]